MIIFIYDLGLYSLFPYDSSILSVSILMSLIKLFLKIQIFLPKIIEGKNECEEEVKGEQIEGSVEAKARERDPLRASSLAE